MLFLFYETDPVQARIQRDESITNKVPCRLLQASACKEPEPIGEDDTLAFLPDVSAFERDRISALHGMTVEAPEKPAPRGRQAKSPA